MLPPIIPPGAAVARRPGPAPAEKPPPERSLQIRPRGLPSIEPARPAGRAGPGSDVEPFSAAPGAPQNRTGSPRPAGTQQIGPSEAGREVARRGAADLEPAPQDRAGSGRIAREQISGGTHNKGQSSQGPAEARPGWASGAAGDTGTTGGGAHLPRVPGLDTPLTHIAPPMVRRVAEPAAGDGMDPTDEVLLHQTQRLLSTSLTFAGGPDEVAERFRAALLQGDPDLLEALPGGARSQTEQFARALTWIVHHLDRPPALVAGCSRLGQALAACGVDLDSPHMIGPALAEAMRAGMPAGAWRQDFDLAWRSTWQHVYQWIRYGAASGEPMIWDAVVVEHDRRRADLAVIRLRPVLPMPFRPGQYARVELPGLPGIWRPYSLAGAPRRDDLIELHVRAKTEQGVSGTLVYRTRVGDPVRISAAEGRMTLPEAGERPLLMIAGDTGVAPLKALLTELADTGDPRQAVLFWGVRNISELYDIAEITEIARAARRATIVPVVSEGNPGPYAMGLVTDAIAAYGEWSAHEAYLAGPPLMLTATSSALQQLGVEPHRIHHDAPG